MSRVRSAEMPSSSNRSTEKALAIIEILAASRTPMRLLDIAKILNYNQSTTLRFLTSLINSGYVGQEDDSQKYYLTYKISRIANKLNQQQDIPRITHPYLVRLSELYSESACISVEQQFQMVYVDVATGNNQILLSMQQIGGTSPMHCTGNGKLLLTTFDDAKIDQLISKVGLKQFTKNTITTKEALLKELDQVRKNGWAMDNEECEIGVRCIAYPIRNYTGNIIAGLSVTGPINRMQESRITQKQPEMQRIAEEISERLGYQK